MMPTKMMPTKITSGNAAAAAINVCLSRPSNSDQTTLMIAGLGAAP
jgi:hypothetical protein